MAVLMSLGIIGIGTRYLIAPEASAATFGVPDWPRGNARAFLRVKGIRDVVSGLVGLTLLALGQRRALGWVLLCIALTPAGDMIIVLRHRGSAAVALGVHGLTGALVLVNSALFLTEGSEIPNDQGNHGREHA